MSEPKFKLGDRVKWDQWGRIGVIAEVHADNRYSLETTWGCLAKFPGAVLSLDVPETPKFKIGDCVKWKDYEGRMLDGTVEIAYPSATRRLGEVYITDSCGKSDWWHESLLSLDVPTAPKFKIGDRVKWTHFGRASSGFVRSCISDGWWGVEYETGCMNKFHESGLSLDVPEPKQFATKLEAELGAEIIRLNFQIIDQRKENAFMVSKMAAEIGNAHRERFAKEAAQKELAEANDKIKRLKSLIGEL